MNQQHILSMTGGEARGTAGCGLGPRAEAAGLWWVWRLDTQVPLQEGLVAQLLQRAASPKVMAFLGQPTAN